MLRPALLAALAVLVSAPAYADTLVDNVQGQTIGADAVSIWQFAGQGEQLVCVARHELSTGKTAVSGALNANEHPIYFAALNADRVLAANDALTDPRTSDLIDPLKPLHLRAMLDATIRRAGKVAGVLCCEQRDGPRAWTAAQIEMAIGLADLAAPAGAAGSIAAPVPAAAAGADDLAARPSPLAAAAGCSAICGAWLRRLSVPIMSSLSEAGRISPDALPPCSAWVAASSPQAVSVNRASETAKGRARRSRRCRNNPPGPRVCASSAAKKPARMKKAGMRNACMKVINRSAMKLRCSSRQAIVVGWIA